MKCLNLLALDLGAESGRAVLGRFDGERLSFKEVHRFANEPVELPDGLHWDALRLSHEMKHGLALAVKQEGRIDALGVDAWGVDFGLLDGGGALLDNPYHYRDHRTDGILDEVFRVAPPREIFARTGIQFMQINSLFQLFALRRQRGALLQTARHLLFMPDLFHYFFTGRMVNEYTVASTSQMLDAGTGQWANDLLDKMQLPTGILGPIVPPGTVLGPLRASVAGETGARDTVVVAPGCHDTASAVAAVPVGRADATAMGATATVDIAPGYAYISSGTWSLLGVEASRPLLGDGVARLNLTNEGGVGGTIRLLKNIMGLWLVQQCRRAWERDGEDLSYDQIARLAEEAPSLVSLVDPNDASFLSPPDMPQAIREFCRRTGQSVPENKGAIVRCVLESLALCYRLTVEQLESVIGHPIGVIHILGGGSKNRLLDQFTADATGRLVVTGPVEATAIGNLLVQAMALGYLRNLEELRQVVRRSFPLEQFEPRTQARSAWDEAYGRFRKLNGGGSLRWREHGR